MRAQFRSVAAMSHTRIQPLPYPDSAEALARFPIGAWHSLPDVRPRALRTRFSGAPGPFCYQHTIRILIVKCRHRESNPAPVTGASR